MRLNRVPVEFVPAGMTAEEARRQRKNNRSDLTRQDVALFVGAIVAFLFVCGFVGWYFVGRGQANEAPVVSTSVNVDTPKLEPNQITATYLAQLSPPKNVTATVTKLPSPVSLPTLTPTETPTETPIAIQPHSPIALPTATPTPTPTATPEPTGYQVLGHDVDYEPLYAYVSGWVVERDGVTPRPIPVILRYPTGVMRYPRPNNRDVANGRYEFLVSPGRYWLQVDEPGGPVVGLVVQDNERHEISFRLWDDRPISAARSQPWVGTEPPPTSPANQEIQSLDPTATPKALPSRMFLPIIQRNYQPQTEIIYLPTITKGGKHD